MNRETVGIPPKHDILDHVHALPEPEQSTAFAQIRAIESEAMATQKPNPGLEKLMTYLESRGVKKGICTRNFEYVLTFSILLSHSDVECRVGGKDDGKDEDWWEKETGQSFAKTSINSIVYQYTISSINFFPANCSFPS